MIRRRILFFILFTIHCSLFTLSVSADDSTLKIHFIDVGEGESILIEAPNGQTALVDAGNSITGVKVLDCLKHHNIKKLNHLIFTHPHLDHIGGSFYIAQALAVDNIHDNAESLDDILKSADIYRWYKELIRGSDKYRPLAAGDSFSLGAVVFRVIWPQKGFVPADFNVHSLVIMVEYRDFKCLLSADVTVPAEEKLLKIHSDLKTDVLKVGHHGSSDASSAEFLKAVAPAAAIISVNRGNIRGYPSSKVLERLKKAGAKIYRTDQDGTILVEVDDKAKMTISGDNCDCSSD